jgi:hypothetical protein
MNNYKERICNQCLENKSLDEFYTQDKIDKNGNFYVYYNPKCIRCCIENASISVRKYWDRHKAQTLEDYHDGTTTHLQKANGERRRKNGQHAIWQKSEIGKIKGKEYYEKRKSKKHNITEKQWEYCKNYFDYCCAYCGLPINENFWKYGGKVVLVDFHKEHLDNDGSNEIDNCVPSCVSCNTSKHKKEFGDWYNSNNPIFSEIRYIRICNWINGDCLTINKT